MKENKIATCRECGKTDRMFPRAQMIMGQVYDFYECGHCDTWTLKSVAETLKSEDDI